MSRHWSWIGVAGILLAFAHAQPASAQTGDNILVVTNALVKVSDEIGTYYATKRAVPGTQILRLQMPDADEIERKEYETKIETPIGNWLTAHKAQDRILYIVLTKGVPLRITGTTGQQATTASVDSELTLLYRKMSGVPVALPGPVRNPYFFGEADPTKAPRFTHKTHDIYLVTRLDGYTVADVKALIDRALEPAKQGTIVLDGKIDVRETLGNRWLATAATSVKRLPGWSDKVVQDNSPTTISDQQNVMGFYTWGSNALNASTRHYNHQYVAGAIAGEYVSTDARTFKEPPANWAINDTKNIFAGSHQSMIGDFIRDGITGVAGHVAEPFLNGTIRPDGLFPAYLSGFNLAEAFYRAMPSLSWQTVVIGDPLCQPFEAKPPEPSDVNPPVDDTTDMPAFMTARRLSAITSSGVKPDAARFVLKSEVARANNDRQGIRTMLEQATALDENLTTAELTLALMAEQDERWDEAVERYQKVIEKSPNNAAALNNLAYLLAVRKNDPEAALPLASRAYIGSVKDAQVGDTLAWTQHLLGHDATAELIIMQALVQRANDPELMLHAAFILAGTGKKTEALKYLNAAITANPKFAERADIQELKKKLQPAK